MVHRIAWRVGSEEALDFWQARLDAAGSHPRRSDGSLLFTDPEGLGLELRVVHSNEEPLRANYPEIPAEFALQGFDGVRVYATDPEASTDLLKNGMGFEPGPDDEWTARGDDRSSFYVYDEAPAKSGLSGGGTVHHVAWSSRMDEHEQWRDRVIGAGAHPTPVIDRFYFRSIYFREPSGVLFEIATLGPGFAVDEPAESLGEALSLPPDYRELREKLEKVLTPLPNPRARAEATAAG